MELLAAVLIIAVLLALALPLYLLSVRNAAAQAVRANLHTLGQASRSYYLRTSQYPSAIDDIVGTGKDIEGVSGPRGVTYDIDVSGSGGGNGNGGNGNGKGGGTGAPGNGKGQGGGNGGPAVTSPCVVRATESGVDAFGTAATDDTATLTLPDSTYTGL